MDWFELIPKILGYGFLVVFAACLVIYFIGEARMRSNYRRNNPDKKL